LAARVRGELRIVGGRWRGRRLAIPSVVGLRPTPDRVRETLFNWLASDLPGAHALDLFAGTGALGFEAVSRGAERVTLVERSALVARHLLSNAQRLGHEGIQIVQADALRWLERAPNPVDLVFLDPPFDLGLWQPAIDRLHAQPWLRTGARVYLEMPVRLGYPELPPHWTLVRDKTAGQVRYGLAIVGPCAAPPAAPSRS
jgi:16S rRNA (guanine966-N2)-methyltransferase